MRVTGGASAEGVKVQRSGGGGGGGGGGGPNRYASLEFAVICPGLKSAREKKRGERRRKGKLCYQEP